MSGSPGHRWAGSRDTIIVRWHPTVLIVDDDAAFRGLAARVLAAMGLQVVGEAGTYAEGAAAAAELRPDAALVDVGLPDGDGIELAAHLVALPWRPRVVVTSSDPDADAARRPSSASARSASWPRRRCRTGRWRRCSPADSVEPVAERTAHRDRRGRRPPARGHRAAADGGGLRRRGAEPATRRTSCAGRWRTGPTSRWSTSRCRRATRTTACARRWSCASKLPDTGDPRPLAVLRGELRARPDRRPRRGRRLPAQGARRRRPSFVDAVQRVAAGGSALDPEIVGRMLGRRRADGPLDELTPREREVLAAMAEGKSNAGIAEELVVTEAAVEKHVGTDLPQARPRARRPPSTGACSRC